MKFEDKYQAQLSGTLHGFDRLMFSGYIMPFFHDSGGMYKYLSHLNVLLKDFKTFGPRHCEKLKGHLEKLAQQSGAESIYINNSHSSKEEVAKGVLAKHPDKTGLIAIIRCIETSPSFRVRGRSGRLYISKEPRSSLHYYLYYQDREFGWMFAKIQGWFPFTMFIYVNGREYLKKQLSAQGVSYEEYRNSIIQVADLPLAQQLSDQLVNKKWDRFFNALARRINPFYQELQELFGQVYRWHVHAAEYASDVLFKARENLEFLYPHLVTHATRFEGGEDIYTFFGRLIHPSCTKEVTGSSKRFQQGFRIKHSLDKNSIKMYDKYSALRVETTINNPRIFKIYKKVVRCGAPALAWVPMGKAVSNLYRFAEVARSANLKYLNALALAPEPSKISKQLEKTTQRVKVKTASGKERWYPALNLLARESSLILEAMCDAKFFLQAFSNRTLRALLITKGFCRIDSHDQDQLKMFSGQITRWLAKFKAHGLITKIQRSFKYRLTKKGRQLAYLVINLKNTQPTFC